MSVNRIASSFAVVLLLGAAAACTKKAPETNDDKPAAPAAGGPVAGPMEPAKATEKAPDTYRVKLTTTKGEVVIEVHRDWSPNGADRVYNLVKLGYFNDIAIFRVIKGFMAQFGIHGNPQVSAPWREATIPDDPPSKQSNTRGRVTFAKASIPNSRSVQLFINYADNSNLDAMGFTPIGEVVSGMEVVDAWEGVYGEGAPRGRGPDQGRVQMEGNRYLRADFPKLDYIQKAEIVQ